MITEDYVTLETAKLLKEKGFECNYEKVIALEDIIEERFEGRTCVGQEVIPAGTFFTPEFGGEYETYDYSPNLFTASAPCPTQAMAMKWLREVHNILICIIPSEVGAGVMDYTYVLYKIDAKNFHFEDLGIQGIAKNISEISYEKAVEEAIKYCLENLI